LESDGDDQFNEFSMYNWDSESDKLLNIFKYPISTKTNEEFSTN
jgi:hypothetical protein